MSKTCAKVIEARELSKGREKGQLFPLLHQIPQGIKEYKGAEEPFFNHHGEFLPTSGHLTCRF